MKHADIIDAKGTEAVAAKLNLTIPHVRVWKSRRIPRSAYGEIMSAFPDITLDMLKAGEPLAPEAKAA